MSRLESGSERSLMLGTFCICGTQASSGSGLMSSLKLTTRFREVVEPPLSLPPLVLPDVLWSLEDTAAAMFMIGGDDDANVDL